MKHKGLFLLAGLLATGRLSAQISADILLAQDQFLPGESIPVSVRVVNNSGQTLHFGAEEWLTYSVEGRENKIVEKYGEAPLAHEFDVESAKMATLHSDLAPYFDLTKPGHYTVSATVVIKDWNAEMTSTNRSFDIITGSKIWEQTFGVPNGSATNHTEPEVRKYILQQATFTRSMKMYLRITDETEGRIFRVVQIGPMISFSRPQTQLDATNNLHLIYQDGARALRYVEFNPDGELLKRQFYLNNTDLSPRLEAGPKGSILVNGGTRRVTSTDFPPPKEGAPPPTLPADE